MELTTKEFTFLVLFSFLGGKFAWPSQRGVYRRQILTSKDDSGALKD